MAECGLRLGYTCRPCRKVAGHVEAGDVEHETSPGACSTIWRDKPGDYAWPTPPSALWSKLESPPP